MQWCEALPGTRVDIELSAAKQHLHDLCAPNLDRFVQRHPRQGPGQGCIIEAAVQERPNDDWALTGIYRVEKDAPVCGDIFLDSHGKELFDGGAVIAGGEGVESTFGVFFCVGSE